MTSFSPDLRSKLRSLSCFFFIGIALFSSKIPFARADAGNITVTINGQQASVDPPPKLVKGAVLVPLRGVLEKLGAIVSYDAAKQRIVVQQGGRTFLLGINLPTATLNQIEIPLSAAPAVDGGRAFVPLRSLAELFGYQVQWQPASNTVLITSTAPLNHLAVLRQWGHFGVTIDTTNINGPGDADLLLDAAQKSGASFIKIRFDWALLQPTASAPFAWTLFDQLVRGAAQRGMGVVGVLGNSTQWASIYQNTPDIDQWRNAPPAEKYFPQWDNYVRRVVGRYSKDVQAWQVWEYPASYNFRSGEKDYRVIVRRGAVMAKLADPNAVVFAGDSGGVNLGFLHDLKNNGIDSVVSGVMLHPVSQWQPGVPAQPSAFLLPYSTLRANKTELYWADALSSPVLSENIPGQQIFYSDDQTLQDRLKSTFTPQTQADYLVKTATLSLAAGIHKDIWGVLRDDAVYPKVDPVNPDTGSGLLTAGMQPRPAYQAFSNLNKLLGNATYVGALAKGPHAVVLLFSDGIQNTAVAWSLDQAESTLGLQVVPASLPAAPGATPETNIPALTAGSATAGPLLKTTYKSQVLDVTGKVLLSAPLLKLSASPVWITHLDPAFIAQFQTQSPEPLDHLTHPADMDFSNGVSADFTMGHETQNGLYWEKYANFRGEAQPVRYNDVSGLATTISRDIYNPAAGNPNIYLDVDDDYLYDEPGTPVKVTLEVYRPPSTGTDPFRAKGGFNIQYDSPDGFLFTPWQEVEQGSGLITYTVEIPRVAFTNRDGYDMIINTWGSKQDLIFHSITVQRMTQPVVVPGPPANPQPQPAATPAPTPTMPPTSPVRAPANVQPAP